MFPSETLHPFSPAFIRLFSRTIRRFNPDVLHVFGLYTAMLALGIRSIRGGRYRIVVTVHRVTEDIRLRPLAKLLGGFLVSRIDFATFLTQFQRDHYASVVRYAPARSEIIPNVVTERAVPEARAAEARRSLLAQMRSDHVAVYAGRIIPSKQLDMFIKTIGEVRGRGFSVAGVIVGDGPEKYRSELHALATRLGLKDAISFAGFSTTPENYMAAADCILFPTQREALPNLIVEAYSLGIPVVVSSIPQLRSIAESGRNALVVTEHTPGAYADALAVLFTNSELRESLSRGARETYLSDFEPGKVARKYAEIYGRLLES